MAIRSTISKCKDMIGKIKDIIVKLKDVAELILCLSLPVILYEKCATTALLNSSYAKEAPARVVEFVEPNILLGYGYYRYEFNLHGRKYEGTTVISYVNCGDTVIVKYWSPMPSLNKLYNPFVGDKYDDN